SLFETAAERSDNLMAIKINQNWGEASPEPGLRPFSGVQATRPSSICHPRSSNFAGHHGSAAASPARKPPQRASQPLATGGEGRYSGKCYARPLSAQTSQAAQPDH